MEDVLENLSLSDEDAPVRNPFVLLVEEDTPDHASCIEITPTSRRRRRRKGRRGGEIKAVARSDAFIPHFEGLDNFLLQAILRQLPAVTLCRARMVCKLWMALIDDCRRIWKDLLLEDFGWKAQSKRKGSNRAAKKRDLIQLYGQLLMKKKGDAARIVRELEQHAGLVRLLSTILPFIVGSSKISSASRDAMLACQHDYTWTEEGHRLESTNKAIVVLQCGSCGAKLYCHQRHWQKIYPAVLEWDTERIKACRHGFHWADQMYQERRGM